MKNQLNEAIHEFHHALDGGADYDDTVQWLAQRYNVDTQILEQAYNNYVLSN